MKDFEKVITKGYPKRMRVWDGSDEARTRKKEVTVLAERFNSNYKYLVLEDDNDYSAFEFAEDLAPEKPRTIEDGLIQGDVIVDRDGDKAKILGVCGEAVIRSCMGDFDTASNTYTIKELIRKGWELDSYIQWISELTAQEPSLVELTLQDISEGKGAGVDPKFIRIKDMVRIDL